MGTCMHTLHSVAQRDRHVSALQGIDVAQRRGCRRRVLPLLFAGWRARHGSRLIYMTTCNAHACTKHPCTLTSVKASSDPVRRERCLRGWRYCAVVALTWSGDLRRCVCVRVPQNAREGVPLRLSCDLCEIVGAKPWVSGNQHAFDFVSSNQGTFEPRARSNGHVRSFRGRLGSCRCGAGRGVWHFGPHGGSLIIDHCARCRESAESHSLEKLKLASRGSWLCIVGRGYM